jgi:hypothetical protein
MRSPRRLTIALGLAAALAAWAEPSAPSADADPRAVLASMEEAAARVQDYTMTLVRQELMGDRLQPERTAIEKWSRPYRLYVHDIAGPDSGQEVLFARGWNADRLRAHRGRFPDITVNLDPQGSWAMAHAHHPVTQASLPGFVKIVLDNLAEGTRRGEGSLRFLGRETLWGRPALELELTSPASVEPHVMAKGETLWDVERLTGQTMYVILHFNRARGWRSARDPHAGDTVLVPRHYAGRVVLDVDEELRLPIRAMIYDHDGNLYERYEHRDLRINVGLTDADFDPKNPAYDF